MGLSYLKSAAFAAGLSTLEIGCGSIAPHTPESEAAHIIQETVDTRMNSIHAQCIPLLGNTLPLSPDTNITSTQQGNVSCTVQQNVSENATIIQNIKAIEWDPATANKRGTAHALSVSIGLDSHGRTEERVSIMQETCTQNRAQHTLNCTNPDSVVFIARNSTCQTILIGSTPSESNGNSEEIPLLQNDCNALRKRVLKESEDFFQAQ